MVRVVYNLKAFDAAKAASGTLCVMVVGNIPESIANVDEKGNINKAFIGAGFCKYRKVNTYSFTVNSTTYLFDQYGNCTSPWSATSCKLALASADVNVTTSGNAAKSRGTTVVTRATDGSTTTKVDYSRESDVIIDTLNARDEFAVNALRELLCHVADPSTLSDTEMSFYCNTAYQWAANMMEASANARGSFKQEQDSSSSDVTTTRAEITESSLSSNTEKLLNNIVAALERTDEIEVSNGETTYSERVKVQFKELIDILNAYVKNGDSTVGLNDLIKAIKNIKVEVTTNDTTNIGDEGLGRDKDHPIYLSGVNPDWYNNYTSLDAFYTAIEEKVKATLDTRVKAWLNATTIVSDGSGGYKLNVPDSIK